MEIQVAKNPETEHTIDLTKKRSHEELEDCEEQQKLQAEEDEKIPDEDELRNLLLSDIGDLPLSPRSATQVNFVTYFITDFTKAGHDQYIYRHANGKLQNYANNVLHS